MGWFTKKSDTSNSTPNKDESYLPENCEYFMTAVQAGIIYRGCKVLTLRNGTKVLTGPGQMNCNLDMLFSPICRMCQLPSIRTNNPCQHLSVGIEIDSMEALHGNKNALKLASACASKSTAINNPVSCNEGCDRYSDN